MIAVFAIIRKWNKLCNSCWPRWILVWKKADREQMRAEMETNQEVKASHEKIEPTIKIKQEQMGVEVKTN
jgi:hypothetical protein